jgi:hypothetical protein
MICPEDDVLKFQGEVNVAQEELNSFLAVAEDLRVKVPLPFFATVFPVRIRIHTLPEHDFNNKGRQIS